MHKSPVAARMREIAPFHVMEVQDRALRLEAQGRRILHLEIGQPDFPAPPQIVEATVEALRERPLGYTESLGIPELREAISRFYEERFRIRVQPERIAITTGASAAFLLSIGAQVGPGDEVLVPDPSYPCSRHMVRAFEGRVKSIPVQALNAYQPTAAEIEDRWTPRTRGVLIASPSNPTGTVIAPGELEAIVAAVRRRSGFALVDEIYQGLIYETETRCALALGEDLIVINSFSKYFNMTGWRLGWIVAPPALLREIEKLAQNLYISPPAPAQYGALAAFRPDTLELLEERKLEFRRRRDFVVPALRSIGFSVPITPQGAFYVYAGCERFSPDSGALAIEILEQAGVAVTPGVDFGENHPERYLRFAYTRSMDQLEEAMERLDRLLAGGAARPRGRAD